MIMKTSNNTNQVGGNYYQFEIEPVHLMVKYNTLIGFREKY